MSDVDAKQWIEVFAYACFGIASLIPAIFMSYTAYKQDKRK